MENGLTELVEELEVAHDDVKKAYIERVWNMSKGELFGELMRVQTESAKMLTASKNEIMRLQNILRELEAGDGLH